MKLEPREESGLKCLLLVSLCEARLIALALCPRGRVALNHLLRRALPTAGSGNIANQGLRLEGVERPRGAANRLENVLAGEDTHGETVEGLPLEFLAARHPELLQFPVKVLRRNAGEGNG